MVGIARLLPKNYLFTILGIAVGVSGLVALGAMAERITRFIDGGDRFVLGQISVAGEGMGMGTGFTAGGLLRAAKIEQIARVPGVAAVQAQVMLPLNPTTSQFLTLTQELILAETSRYFNISPEELLSPNRNRTVATARQIAMYLCRELTDLSLPRIGQRFGGRDHSTVMHAASKIRGLMAQQRSTYTQIQELTSRIRTRAKSL